MKCKFLTRGFSDPYVILRGAKQKINVLQRNQRIEIMVFFKNYPIRVSVPLFIKSIPG
jgi:hypothetical protein